MKRLANTLAELLDACDRCRRRAARVFGLLEEEGVTQRSIHNAHVLVEKYGRPDHIGFRVHPRDGQVVSWWWDPSEKTGGANREHLFTGFSWGYAGEGPSGLFAVLTALGVSITRSEIAGWEGDPRGISFHRGEHY